MLAFMHPNLVVRHSLLKYPTLYKNRIQVFMHLFATNGNGYDWDTETGELVSVTSPEPTEKQIMRMKMRYDDLNEREEKLRKDDGMECYKTLHDAWKLTIAAERQYRKFVAKNIDIMSTNSRATLCADYEIYGGYYIEKPSLRYSLLFRSPENVSKDWAEAMLEFISFWLQRLYGTYQFGSDDRPEKDKVYTGDAANAWEACKKMKELTLTLRVRIYGEEEVRRQEKARERLVKDIAERLKKAS